MPLKPKIKKRKPRPRKVAVAKSLLAFSKPSKFSSSIFLSNNAKIIVTCFLIALLLLSPFLRTKKIVAEETIFYPNTCTGNWNNAAAIAGAPTSDKELASNLAQPTGANQEIVCTNFTGDLPASVSILGAELEFVWSHNQPAASQSPEVPIDKSFDPINNQVSPTEKVSPSNDQSSSTPDTLTIPEQPTSTEPLIIENPSQPIDQSVPVVDPATESQILPPSSFLPNLFHKTFATTALAQTDTNLINDAVPQDVTNTDKTVEQPNEIPPIEFVNPVVDVNSNTALFDVKYALDESSWQTVGQLESGNLSSRFPVSVTSDNISLLKVSLTSRMTIDEANDLSLKEVKLIIKYFDSNAPTVIVKDTNNILTGKKDYNSDEPVVFTVVDPNVNIGDIKRLLDQDKIEVVDDKEGLLGKKIDVNEGKDVVPNNTPPVSAPEIPAPRNFIPLDSEPPTSTVVPTNTNAGPVSWFEKITSFNIALAQTNEISALVLDLNGNPTNIIAQVTTVMVDGQETRQIKVNKPEPNFRPGKYTLQVTIPTIEATIISKQDFTWGVLALNVNKTIYEVGDNAYIQMGVLTDSGHTVCDAVLDLIITSPQGEVTKFFTADDSIIKSPECGPDNVIDVPDYYTHFIIPDEIGTYTMKLIAQNVNGIRTVTDTFQVVQTSPFVVERVGPTRIYPLATYPMTIHVTAKDNWQGTVVERVPSSFEISQPLHNISYDSVVTDGETKIISWNVSLFAGQEITLVYNFDAPDISPEFYLLGKITLTNSSNVDSFQEIRNWQIASDAAITTAGSGNWNSTTANAPWPGGVVPANTDTVTIAAGHTITVTANATIAGITLASPTTANKLIINTGVTFTDTGSVAYTNNATANAQTIQLNGTAIMNVGTTFNMGVPSAAGAAQVDTTTGTCTTCQLNVTGLTTVGNNSTTAAGRGLISFATGSGTFSTGSLTIAGGTTSTAGIATVTTATGTITVNGAVTFSGTAAKTLLAVTGAGILNLNNSAFGTGGTLSIANATVRTSGASAINGAYTFPNLNVISGTTTMASFAIVITGATNITGTLTNLTGATLKTFTGLVTVNAGGSFLMNVGTSPTFSFGGGIAMNGTTFTTGTGTTTLTATQAFSGSSAMTIGAAISIPTGTTLTISNTNTVTFSSTITMPVGSPNLIVATGSTVVLTTLTFTANSTAGGAQLVTIQGTGSLKPSAITMPATASTGTAKITATGSGGSLIVSGTTAVSGAGTAGFGLSSIDFSATDTNFTTNALTVTGGTATNASVIVGTGTLTTNGLLTLAGPASGTGLAILTTATGKYVIKLGLTMSGTVIANAQFLATGAATITLTGTMTGNGTITINSATTFNTTGAATLSSACTLPNLNVLANTTTLGAQIITVSGATNITGALANLNGAQAKTFSGLVTINSGGSVALTTATVPVVNFGAGIDTVAGAGSVNFGTGATTFTANQSLDGPVGITLGAVTINSGVTLTNNITATVTMASLTMSSATVSNALSLTTGTTTTVTNALTFTANAGVANNQTITMNGTANLNAGSVVMNAPTNTGNSTISCSGGSGAFTVTGALGVTAGATAGASTVAMDTCTLTANGLVTITGGATGVASISASTGTLDFNLGITFAVTLAQARITTSGAATIDISGTMTGLGILSGINALSTINLKTATVNAAYTFPNVAAFNIFSGTNIMGAAVTVTNNLNVSLGATLQFGAFAFTSSGPTIVDGTIRCVAAASCTGLKTFTGLLDINAGDTFDLAVGAPTTPATTSFAGGITMDGATFNTYTGTTVFTANQNLAGAAAMTFGGTVTINTGVTVTNNNTSTVTFAALTLANATSGITGMSLTTASTTTVTGALTYTVNTSANNQNIIMNGTANLNAGSVVIPAPTTSTGSSLVTCSAGSGTFTVTGALGIAAGATSGASTVAIDTCTLMANGLVTITGGTVGVASISASTGIIDINNGITFAVTLAQARITTSGAATINISGTMAGLGILSGINAATTINTVSTVNINAAYTFPNLVAFNVSTGTTTLGAAIVFTSPLQVTNGATLLFGAFAFTASNATTVNGIVDCPAAASCTGLKTFTGLLNVNTGGVFDLTGASVAPTLSFAGGITMDGTTLNTDIGATTFTASQALTGGTNMTIGATTINSGVTLTNNNTATVTINSLTMAVPTVANNLILSTATTTSVTNSVAYANNTTANNQTIQLNGTAIMNVGTTFDTGTPSSTGLAQVNTTAGTCTTCQLNVAGAVTVRNSSGATAGKGLIDFTTGTGIFSAGSLTIAGGATGSSVATVTTVTGTITINGNLTFTGTQSKTALTVSGVGVLNFSNSTVGAGGNLNLGGGSITNFSNTCTINSSFTSYGYVNINSGTTTLGADGINFAQNLSVVNGAVLQFGAFTFTVGNNTTVDGTIRCTAAASCTGLKTFTGLVTINSGGVFDLTVGAPTVVPTLSFAGGITMNGTTFNTNTGAITFTANQNLSGTAAMIFGGAATINDTFTLTNLNTSTVDFNSNLLGAGTNANFAPDLNSITRFAGTVMSVGKITPSTSVSTVEYDGGTQTIKAPTTNPYYNLNITTAGIKSLGAATSVSGTTNISAGTLDTVSGSNRALNTGDLIIGGSGTMLAQGSTITLTGNWSNSGTFTAGTSTVVLGGNAGALVSGTTTFTNLTISSTIAKEVDFQTTGSDIFHITGAFVVTGHSGNKILLYSYNPGVQWHIHPTGTASVDYADVQDSVCEIGSIPINPTNFTNSGNNGTCWAAPSITMSMSLSAPAIGFGLLSSSSARYATGDSLGSGTQTSAHTIFVSSSGTTSGYALYVQGASLNKGANTITAIGATPAASNPGNEQFGIRATVSGGTATVSSPYNHATNYGYNSTATTQSTIGTTTADSADTFVIYYLCNISPVTPSGNYSTTLTYTAVGSF